MESRAGAAVTPGEIRRFWFEELAPKDWFSPGETLDAEIARRFGAAWEAAAAGALDRWQTGAEGCLAFVLLTDQFPRNMFRGTARAFATDPEARAAAKSAVARGLDLRLAPAERAFLYMPLVHAETLADQDRGVRLMLMRVPGDAGTLLHARCHREVIRRFGRFPFRNAALGRQHTAAEAAFLAAGGYGAVVRALSGAAA